MQSRCLNADGKHRTYKNVRCLFSEAEFLKWAIPLIEVFNIQYPAETASIDRIDPYGDYAPGNVRIITWTSHLTMKKRARIERDRRRAAEWAASKLPSKPSGSPTNTSQTIQPTFTTTVPTKPPEGIYAQAKVGTVFLW
jgi:hypothetical protein